MTQVKNNQLNKEENPSNLMASTNSKKESPQLRYYFKHLPRYLWILIKKTFRKAKWSEITVDELLNLLNAKQPLLIFDLRTPQEFADGHISIASPISLTEIKANLEDLQPFKEKSIVTICPGGGLSLVAVDVLERAGFIDVKSLKGGMDLWCQKGFPTTQAEYLNEEIDLESIKERAKQQEKKQILNEKYVGGVHKTLDVLNLSCPTPILKSKKALKTLKIGQVLEIFASHPSSIPDWALSTGQELLASEERDSNDYRFVVKRMK